MPEEKEVRHAGKVKISQKALLDWLQFEGGEIHQASIHEVFGDVELIIEHPDLPEYQLGDCLQTVTPNYIKHVGENGQLLSIERVKK